MCQKRWLSLKPDLQDRQIGFSSRKTGVSFGQVSAVPWGSCLTRNVFPFVRVPLDPGMHGPRATAIKSVVLDIKTRAPDGLKLPTGKYTLEPGKERMQR